MKAKPAQYQDGNRKNPVQCIDWFEAFDCCRERDRPCIVAVHEPGGEFDDPDSAGTITLPDRTIIAKVFPSGKCDEIEVTDG